MSKASCASTPDSAFVGFANLPNQVHRKIAKRGFEFTLMVMGASGLGKSTLINSLFLTDLYPEREIIPAQKLLKATVEIDASTVEIEERGVKVRLTLVDTPGFGDALDSKNCHQPIIEYIEKQFEKYLKDESGLNRRNISDNRVHCLFYFISPFCKGMRALDIECLKFLHNRVNIVPIIGKADALMPSELAFLKNRILEQLKENNIKIYEIPVCDDEDDDNEFREQNKRLREAVPFAVCGSAETYEIKGRKIRGRMYPWGLVDIENKDHCDFIKLRTMLITHMQDLQEITHEVHYENFRSERLNRREESDKILQEKEEELRAVHEMLAKMKAQMAAKS